MKKGIISLFTMLFFPLITFAGNDSKSFDELINEYMTPVTSFLESIVFASFNIPVGDQVFSVPFVLVWLIAGAILFTFYFRFINIRGFKTSIDIVRGKYTDPNDKGEVSHFQALTAALSGTVGLGNIAGVAIAISLGGPGATFWIIIAGLLGMSTKFVECTLGVKYRQISEDGTVYGGPMYYLRQGFTDLKMNIGGKVKDYSKMGKVLAIFFAIACIGGSFGGGNMFQSNQAYKQFVSVTSNDITEENISDYIGKEVYSKSNIKDPYKLVSVENDNVIIRSLKKSSSKVDDVKLTTAEFSEKYNDPKYNGLGWLFGLIVALVVGVVIIGGIKSIARVTDKIVPFMCGIYVLAALIVIFYHVGDIPHAFKTIFNGAFNPDAVYGGVVGVLIVGFQRAAFSNEAGIGSASIAHSAVKTKHPVSEGLVSLLEPFIDTVVVCTMTALVIVITGNYSDMNASDGIALTSGAFESVISWFPIVLACAVLLFAFSTMISWSYYGMQAWAYLFGRSKKQEYIYKAIFCGVVVLGASAELGPVIGFSDCMIFLMCFPNIFGLIFLAPVVKNELNNFLSGIKSGEIKQYKK